MNESVKKGSTRVMQLPFVCECGDPACTEHVPLTRPEYEALPAEPPGLALAEGHELSGNWQRRRRELDG